MTGRTATLSISTRGLAPHIVDATFLKQLQILLRRGVHVTISMQIDAVKWRGRSKDWARAFDAINDLSKARQELLTVRTTRENRYYHVAWDDRVALVANRPMLSNHGRVRSFDQFAGFVLQEPKLIAHYLARVNK